MGDPRNPKRIDELWNPARLIVLENQIRAIPDVVVSGGWAWHFMSPPHAEKKILHDHKDVDLLVEPEAFASVVEFLQRHGYRKTWTRFDKHSDGKFHRYERHVEFCPHGSTLESSESVKVIIDLFIVSDIRSRSVSGVNVLDPAVLLSMYSAKKHTTDDCTAVFRARGLIARGIDPVGHPDLVKVHV